MDGALHDVERSAGVALHTIVGLKRRMSAQVDGSDLHLVHDELVELSRILGDVSQLRFKTFSGTPKEKLDILKAVYRDMRVILKNLDDAREICSGVVDGGPNGLNPHSSSELIAERRSRRPSKERISLVSRHLREHRLSLLSKLVVLNTVKLIETYPDEHSQRHNVYLPCDSQQVTPSSRSVVAEAPGGDRDALDWPEEKSIRHHVDNEKYLSSEMFPVFKHMRQEALRDTPWKRPETEEPLQSPPSPSLHQLALSDMHYKRSRQKEAYFQHLDHAFSKITHSPPANERRVRRFSVQGQPRSAGASMCGPRCRCRCHSNRSVARLNLSAFTKTLGSFSFSFSGPNPGTSACTDPACKTRRARWLRVTYVFPSWLFQAAMTASLSDGIGSPELIIRVCRVIPTNLSGGYYNIFGYISRRDVDSTKEAVRRKQVSVTDILNTGMTPIGFALRHFSIPMVRFLLQEGADLFQEGPSSVAPPGFMMALEKIYTDPAIPSSDRALLEELLPLDTIIEMAGLSPLHKVVLGIRCLDLGELLRLDVCPVDKLDYLGRTALHWAAAKGDATAVSQLLEAGAQLECKTHLQAESPLVFACRTGANPEAIRVLLAAGADFNTTDSYGQTPLCLTVGAPGGRNRTEIAAALLDAGANVNGEQSDDSARATPLDFACVFNHAEMVQFLIGAGADVYHQDRDGSTPLMNAVVYHACETVEVLLKHGVDIRTKDHDGKNVLHCVAEVSNEDMMTVFATTGPRCVVDPEQKDNKGRTPLDTFDERTISAPPGLREKLVQLLQMFRERYNHSLGVEHDSDDEVQFFDASDKWDDEARADYATFP